MEISFEILEFNPTAEISYDTHVTNNLGQYNLILGRDFLHKLEINLNFSTGTMTWENCKIAMKNPKYNEDQTFYYLPEESFVSKHSDHIAKIIDTKYSPAILNEITENL